MFGTDGSAFGAEWSISAIAKSPIEEWEKQAILKETAASLPLERADNITVAARAA
ncbi:hypothetical protein OAJ57_00860 [Alphaproteobacteria bacterium]|nr:hypothetical protein [Alphaproteobacteria bacterium]